MSNQASVRQVGKHLGKWHKCVLNQFGRQRWVPCGDSFRKGAQIPQGDVNLGGFDPKTSAVGKVLHLIDGLLPDDFITYLREEAEAVSGHGLADGVGIKADGDVVKVSVHMSFSLENSQALSPGETGL
jgi:hypothetical protein